MMSVKRNKFKEKKNIRKERGGYKICGREKDKRNAKKR